MRSKRNNHAAFDAPDNNITGGADKPRRRAVVVTAGERAALPENPADIDAGGEAVKDTLDRIKSEKAEKRERKKNSSQIALKVLAIIFFPVTLIVLGLRRLFKKFKVGIAAKVTVIFSVVFGVLIITYAAFTVASIGSFEIGRAHV